MFIVILQLGLFIDRVQFKLVHQLMLASINNAAFKEKSFEKETSIWTKLSIYIIVFALSPSPPFSLSKSPLSLAEKSRKDADFSNLSGIAVKTENFTCFLRYIAPNAGNPIIAKIVPEMCTTQISPIYCPKQHRNVTNHRSHQLKIGLRQNCRHYS